MRPRIVVAAVLFGIVNINLSVSALAGQFSVTPVRIFMEPKDRAVAVTVTNQGDEELVMQADAFVWSQERDGEDKLTPSEDLFLSPPIIKLAPKARQVVRLAMLQRPQSGPQRTYRLIVREIPEARKGTKTVELQVALAFSLPVFVTPPGAKRDLQCSVERAAADSVTATCENVGTAYAQPRDFALSNVVGSKIAGRDNGGYILPGVKRGFAIKRAEGKIPAGPAKLTVTLDDNTVQTYDVAISE